MAVTLVVAWSPLKEDEILELRHVKDMRQGRDVADELYQRHPYAKRISLYAEMDAYAAPKPDAYKESSDIDAK